LAAPSERTVGGQQVAGGVSLLSQNPAPIETSAIATSTAAVSSRPERGLEDIIWTNAISG